MKNRIYFLMGVSILYGIMPAGALAEKASSAPPSEKKHSERLVYLAPFKNLSGSSIDTGLLEKTMAEYLTNRKSPRFILRKAVSANLTIDVNILEYRYSKKSFSEKSANRSSLLLDALQEENHAFLKARFMVRNQKGFLLWKNTIQSHFVQNNMTNEEAQTKVFNRVCRIFIKKCFGKNSPISL